MNDFWASWHWGEFAICIAVSLVLGTLVLIVSEFFYRFLYY